MGTRGAVGFRIDGQEKITYNHFDSYPSYLGERVAAFIRKHRRDGKLFKSTTATIRKIEVVNEDSTPTPAQIKKYKHLFESVSTGKLTEWYALLRGLQGDLNGYVREGVMIDGHEFINASLFCEWAYVVNLDTNTLEVYEGFQKTPGRGRYAEAVPIRPADWRPEYVGDKFWYPCSLIAEIPFADIPLKGRFEKYLHDIGALKEDDEGIETLNSLVPSSTI